MKINPCKFSTPVLGDDTRTLYHGLYANNGDRFVDILSTSPDEIAVISRLIAYLKHRKGEGHSGYAKDGEGDRTV